MIKYTLRRLLALVPKLLLISIIIFIGLEALPGDAVTRSLTPKQLEILTQEQIEEMRENAGLNDPLPVQYFRWLWNLLRGDFGYSQSTGSNIAVMLATNSPILKNFWALLMRVKPLRAAAEFIAAIPGKLPFGKKNGKAGEAQ